MVSCFFFLASFFFFLFLHCLGCWNLAIILSFRVRAGRSDQSEYRDGHNGENRRLWEGIGTKIWARLFASHLFIEY